MPILRNESGIVYTSLQEINPLIAPSEVGVFKIHSEAEVLLKNPLDSKTSVEIYKYIPSDLDHSFRQRGLNPSVAISYWSGSDEKVHDRVKRSLAPHTNSVGNNEVHLIVSGALIIYIDNGQGQYATLLQPGDWIYIDGKSEAWPKLTFESSFTLVSYHSSPLAPVDEFHKDLKFTATEMKNIL